MKKEKKFIKLDDFKLEKLKGGLEGVKVITSFHETAGACEPGQSEGDKPCWDCTSGTSASHANIKDICEALQQSNESAP